MKVIDLFAGCGGMSLGFELAGYEVVFANELDHWAAETYRKNHVNTQVVVENIEKIIDLKCLSNEYNLHDIDGIVGGPPCQGFSLSGNRDPKDPRNSLFMSFVRFVKYFRPKFFIMENVPGILSMHTTGCRKVVDIIIQEYQTIGYNVTFSKLNAVQYGVPQSRERVFFIGLKNDLPYNKQKLFPKPFLPANQYISVEDAISDLPQIGSGEGEEFMEYFNKPETEYQLWVRDKSKGIYNHVAMRHTSRLIERFKVIQCEQSVKDVPHEHSALKRGDPSVKSGKIFSQNNMRVNPSKPCPTIAASFQSNFVHPFLNRNFTAREGARLQSFPDSYIFYGKRTTMSWEKNLSQYQQIGNAVPPLLAKAVANNLHAYFENIKKIKHDYHYLYEPQLQLFDSN